MGKAKICGLIIDRREMGEPGAFDDKTDEELMEEARNRAAALGLLANDGVDTRTIQGYLGHKSIQHTVRYTELSPTRFKSLFRD